MLNCSDSLSFHNYLQTPEVNNPGDPLEISILQSTVDKLETEKESLKNTVSELQNLLKRIGVEHEREAQRRRTSTRTLLEEVKRFQAALHTTEPCASHLDTVMEYWSSFC